MPSEESQGRTIRQQVVDLGGLLLIVLTFLGLAGLVLATDWGAL